MNQPLPNFHRAQELLRVWRVADVYALAVRLDVELAFSRKRCFELQRIVNNLEENNEGLRAVCTGIEWEPPAQLQMILGEAQILLALYTNERCSREALRSILSKPMRRKQAENINSLHVTICRIRAKLRPYGIEITTICGVGYCLGLDAKEALRKMGSEG